MKGAVCTTQTVSDERHYFLACPAFQGIRADYDTLFQSAGSMQLFMWQRDQKAVSDAALQHSDISTLSACWVYSLLPDFYAFIQRAHAFIQRKIEIA